MDEKDLVAAVAAPQEKQPSSGHDPLAEQKAAFQALLEAEKDENGPNPEKAAKAAAKKARESKTKTPESKNKTAAKGAEKAPEAPESEPEKKPDPEVQRLREKLRLSGAPKAAIETLSDDDVREWWTTQEEREKTRAQALERASAAEKRLAALQETTEKTSEPAKGVPTETSDLEEIARDLADQFGQEEGGTILEALKALTSPLQEQVKELQAVIDGARKTGMENLSKSNRQRLSEKLPFLAESDDAWSALRSVVEATAQEHTSLEDAYDAAFEKFYGPMVKAMEAKAAEPEPVPEDDAEDEKARIAASSVTPPQTKKRDKKPTPMEAAFSSWRVLQKDPEDVDGARRAYQRAGSIVT